MAPGGAQVSTFQLLTRDWLPWSRSRPIQPDPEPPQDPGAQRALRGLGTAQAARLRGGQLPVPWVSGDHPGAPWEADSTVMRRPYEACVPGRRGESRSTDTAMARSCKLGAGELGGWRLWKALSCSPCYGYRPATSSAPAVTPRKGRVAVCP